MEVWDPIGVRDAPEAEDEYDDYVGKVCVMLMQERASASAIAAHLHDIAIDRMGLSPTLELMAASIAAAKVIVELRPSPETQ
jgi:hypothetical protein